MRKTLFILIFILGSLSAVTAQNKLSLNQEGSPRYLHFFPNPAVSVINFDFSAGYDRNTTLEIYNFIGKKVYDSHVATAKVTIPLTDFFRGLYIFQLRDRYGKILESGKFQVSK